MKETSKGWWCFRDQYHLENLIALSTKGKQEEIWTKGLPMEVIVERHVESALCKLSAKFRMVQEKNMLSLSALVSHSLNHLEARCKQAWGL